MSDQDTTQTGAAGEMSSSTAMTIEPAPPRALVIATLSAGYISGKLAQRNLYDKVSLNPDDILEAIMPLADRILTLD